MTGWVIWPAGASDQMDLVRLERQAFGQRSWGENSLDASFVAEGVGVLFGGKIGNSPLGFAIWRNLSSEAELLSIGVLPEARKIALGAALLGAVLAAAKNAGAKKLFLEVDAGNEAALALYRKSGFVEIGRRSAYYRDGADALAMQVKL